MKQAERTRADVQADWVAAVKEWRSALDAMRVARRDLETLMVVNNVVRSELAYIAGAIKLIEGNASPAGPLARWQGMQTELMARQEKFFADELKAALSFVESREAYLAARERKGEIGLERDNFWIEEAARELDQP